MATLTYLDDLSTDRDKVRFYIQDTTADSGPKPGGSNFSDDEIAGMVTLEGSWQRAVAGIFEVLAGLWAQYVDTQVGPRRQSLSQVAEQYRKLAKEWRDDYGRGGSRVGSRFMTRIDGYSDDVAANEV